MMMQVWEYKKMKQEHMRMKNALQMIRELPLFEQDTRYLQEATGIAESALEDMEE